MFLFFFVVVVVVCFGQLPEILRAYSCLCTQGPLLAGAQELKACQDRTHVACVQGKCPACCTMVTHLHLMLLKPKNWNMVFKCNRILSIALTQKLPSLFGFLFLLVWVFWFCCWFWVFFFFLVVFGPHPVTLGLFLAQNRSWLGGPYRTPGIKFGFVLGQPCARLAPYSCATTVTHTRFLLRKISSFVKKLAVFLKLNPLK